MQSVGSYEAKTHLPALLDRVAQGEQITITRHGVPVAMLVPALALGSPMFEKRSRPCSSFAKEIGWTAFRFGR